MSFFHSFFLRMFVETSASAFVSSCFFFVASCFQCLSLYSHMNIVRQSRKEGVNDMKKTVKGGSRNESRVLSFGRSYLRSVDRWFDLSFVFFLPPLLRSFVHSSACSFVCLFFFALFFHFQSLDIDANILRHSLVVSRWRNRAVAHGEPVVSPWRRPELLTSS